MTAREMLLATVLQPSVLHPDLIHIPVIVLSGRNERGRDETPERVDFARAVSLLREPQIAVGGNTWEEAVNAMPALNGQVTIVTHAYHGLRAFLTWLRAAQVLGKDRTLRIYTLCAPSLAARLPREYEKIDSYQENGTCASYADGVAYVEWRDGV